MPLKTDHIIYTVPDLDAAVATLAARLGVQPHFGGQHPGKGSHNALLSLGNDIYLEIIARDPSQPEPPSPRSFGLDQLIEEKLATWAVRTADIEATAQQARTAGYDPGEIVDGGRKRDDGLDLKWRSTRRPEALTGETPPGDWLIPFVIDWGDTPHPAATGNQNCRLLSLEATHPDPDSIRAMLNALDVSLTVLKTPDVKLVATIDSPNGMITLS